MQAFFIRQGPLLLTFLLAAAMLASLGWQVYGFWQQQQALEARPASAGKTVARAAPRDKAADVELGSLHLFGQPGQEEQPQVQETEDLPETNLRLVLRGVMSGTEDAPASALVEGPDKQTEIYRVGGSLPGNASLHKVFPDRIVLSRGGQLENLYFPDDFEDSGIERYAAVDSAPDARDEMRDDYPSEVPAQVQSAADQQATGVDISEERKAEIRERLEKLRERLRANY